MAGLFCPRHTHFSLPAPCFFCGFISCWIPVCSRITRQVKYADICCYLHYWFLNLLLVTTTIFATFIYINAVLPVLESVIYLLQSSFPKWNFIICHGPGTVFTVASSFIVRRSQCVLYIVKHLSLDCYTYLFLGSQWGRYSSTTFRICLLQAPYR